MNTDTINKIEEIYEVNKKQYSSINLSNIMSIMLIKKAIINSDDRSLIDALIYYHYYILLGVLNKYEKKERLCKI